MSRFNQFSEELLNLAREHFADAKVEITDIQKNNGLVLKALIIHENGFNVSPTIYLEHFFEMYENDNSIEIIFKEIVDTYYQYKIEEPVDVSKLEDFEFVKPRIIYSLINTEKNEELLSDVPHRNFFDLSIVYYILFETDECSIARSLIHNNHCERWGVTEKELYSYSKVNSLVIQKPEFKSLLDFLQELDESLKLEENGLYILTNEKKSYGAAYMADYICLESIAENLKSDIVILPSSVHEVMILQDLGNLFYDELEKMVTNINATQVAETEFLSNHIYLYSREKGTLSVYERS